MIKIMNLRTDKPSQPYDVRVDRSSPLGNPFTLMKQESAQEREEVCDKFLKYFAEKIDDKTQVNSDFMKELNRLEKIYKEHGKLRLFCWCAPKRCHAETIKYYFEIIKFIEDNPPIEIKYDYNIDGNFYKHGAVTVPGNYTNEQIEAAIKQDLLTDIEITWNRP